MWVNAILVAVLFMVSYKYYRDIRWIVSTLKKIKNSLEVDHRIAAHTETVQALVSLHEAESYLELK